MSKELIDKPARKKYDLSEVEFIEYVESQSQAEKPIFSVADILRFQEMAGSAPRVSDAEGHSSTNYRLMKFIDIKPLLETIEAKRVKVAA